MCSYSRPGQVHVSEATHELVSDRFAAVSRGERVIKGKGTMRTFTLLNLPADQLESVLREGGLYLAGVTASEPGLLSV